VGAGGVEPPAPSVSGGSGLLATPRAAPLCSVLPQLKDGVAEVAVRWREGSRGVRSGKSLACPWARILLWSASGRQATSPGSIPPPRPTTRVAAPSGTAAIRSPDEPVPRAPCELAAASEQLGDWAGPVGPTRDHPARPRVKLGPRRPPATLGSSQLAGAGGRGGTSLPPGVCRAGWYSRRVRASAERGRDPAPGRAEADFGPRPPHSAQPCRAEQGNPARRTRHHGRVPEVDDQLAALRRLPAAFGPIQVVEVIRRRPGRRPGRDAGRVDRGGKDGRPEADDS
jgi:hypothetical protein